MNRCDLLQQIEKPFSVCHFQQIIFAWIAENREVIFSKSRLYFHWKCRNNFLIETLTLAFTTLIDAVICMLIFIFHAIIRSCLIHIAAATKSLPLLSYWLIWTKPEWRLRIKDQKLLLQRSLWRSFWCHSHTFTGRHHFLGLWWHHEGLLWTELPAKFT